MGRMAAWAYGPMAVWPHVRIYGRVAACTRLIELGKVVLHHERLHHPINLRLLQTAPTAEISELVEAPLTDRLIGESATGERRAELARGDCRATTTAARLHAAPHHVPAQLQSLGSVPRIK